MKNYLMGWEAAELFRQHTGLRLHASSTCGKLVIADVRPIRAYVNVLYGPYHDEENRDVRLFINYRMLDEHINMDLLVQDCDDDAFLNSHALGTEKYHDLRVAL